MSFETRVLVASLVLAMAVACPARADTEPEEPIAGTTSEEGALPEAGEAEEAAAGTVAAPEAALAVDAVATSPAPAAPVAAAPPPPAGALASPEAPLLDALGERLDLLEVQVREMRSLYERLRGAPAGAPATPPEAEPARPPETSPRMPRPDLFLMGFESLLRDGKRLTRYRLAVGNTGLLPDELFRPAPELPPCGKNKAAARTWVELRSGAGKRLKVFCGFRSATSLSSLWFDVPEGKEPPREVVLVLVDRALRRSLESNRVPLSGFLAPAEEMEPDPMTPLGSDPGEPHRR